MVTIVVILIWRFILGADVRNPTYRVTDRTRLAIRVRVFKGARSGSRRRYRSKGMFSAITFTKEFGIQQLEKS